MEEWYRQALQAGASWDEARSLSWQEWTLLTQAHARTAYRKDQRALLVLNAVSMGDGTVTLSDLHGGSGTKRQAPEDEEMKARVMKRRGIKKDLSTNRL